MGYAPQSTVLYGPNVIPYIITPKYVLHANIINEYIWITQIRLTTTTSPPEQENHIWPKQWQQKPTLLSFLYLRPI
jgi:hypothetical protein